MKKVVISKLFLYKHRFIIGYILLGLALAATIFLLPLITPGGLSEAEMQSAVSSNNIGFSSLLKGNVIDFPYHIVQHYTIHFFGLSSYSIKLPSIIIGIILAVLLILLLNRWFKNNVALIASILTVLSPPFLYLAGSGTPLIMVVFWPTLLLWLGSKIQGVGRPRAIYCFLFAFVMLFAILTPHIIYLIALILIFVLFQPHLRHVIKTLPKFPFLLITLIILLGLGATAFSLSQNPSAVTDLLLTENFSFDTLLNNLNSAIRPLFAWTGGGDGNFLAPLIGLPLLALAITGLISAAKGFFASRNSIATLLIIYTLLIASLQPNAIVLIILPIAILTAHGIRFILNHWYSLFPENPYARVFAIIPLATLIGIILFSDISNFIFGYRYNPAVANNFNNDLALVSDNLTSGTVLLIDSNSTEYNFFQILTDGHQNITVTDQYTGQTGKIASLRKWDDVENLKIERIITSPKSQESDRIYLYSVKEKKE